jgi:hypothetical protein
MRPYDVLKSEGPFLDFFRAFGEEMRNNPENGIGLYDDFICAAKELIPKDMDNIFQNFAILIELMENDESVPGYLRNFVIVQIHRYTNDRLVAIQMRLFDEMGGR